MEVHISYFAVMKEKAGRSAESLTVSPGISAGELLRIIADKYRLSLGLDAIRVAVNDQFVSNATILAPQDRVVFIPPVSGG